jgi:NAD(P)-dependent dehydrogenase (short-subunit alcohol dehydrogenase family)
MAAGQRPVVLITGAGRRLGADLAHLFASAGHHVLLHANRSVAEAGALADRLRAQGHLADVLTCDLAAPETVPAFMADLIARFGAPDILVNNASLFEYDQPGSADPARLARSLDVHVVSVTRIIEAAVAAKPADRQLTVFNLLDQKLASLNPDYFSYTLGKLGLAGITAMWQAARRSDMRVFGLLPGLMYPSGKQTGPEFERDLTKSPLARVVSAGDIFDAMAFCLAHPQLPAQNLTIDCGESLMQRPRDIAFEVSSA